MFLDFMNYYELRVPFITFDEVTRLLQGNHIANYLFHPQFQ